METAKRTGRARMGRLGRTALAVALAASMAFPVLAFAEIEGELDLVDGVPPTEEAPVEEENPQAPQDSKEDDLEPFEEDDASEESEGSGNESGESAEQPESLELDTQATSTARQVYDAFSAVLDEGLTKQFVIIGTHPYSHQSYFIAEVSGDAIPELFVSAETAKTLSVYQYGAINRKAIYIGEVYVDRRLFYHGKDGHTLYNNYRDAAAALDKITAANGSV